MGKAIFFNILFIFSLSAMAWAEGEVVANDLGKEKPKSSYILDSKSGKDVRSFSLRSGINFKGENLINTAPSTNSSYLQFLNNDNYMKEQNYLQPSKRKAILSKLTFNPNELLRNYSGK